MTSGAASGSEQLAGSPSRLPLLFLCHRIPYPPDKGDKIRSWHLLRELSKDFAIHLATFVDNDDDWIHVPTLRAYCDRVSCLPLNPRRATLRSLPGFFLGDPLGLHYYGSRAMQREVRHCLGALDIQCVLVFSSVMARFLPEHQRLKRLVVDFVDVDSDKWLQYAPRKAWPLSWVYRREGERLLEYERSVARRADASLFVSKDEASLFRHKAPETAARTGHFENGVDSDYFSAAHALENPYKDGQEALVFTGAMDYWPNVDAVVHFAQEIFPHLRAERPGLQFWIVGSGPSAEVRELASQDVLVTGRVPDVRPYIAHALAAVAPMRIARGVQNKVLEAMSMGRPVLVSSLGLEGIAAQPGEAVLCCASLDDYRQALKQLPASGPKLGRRAREYVLGNSNWSANVQPVRALLRAEGAEQSMGMAAL